MQFMANPIKHCKECVLKAVEADGNALQHADSLARANKEVVLGAWISNVVAHNVTDLWMIKIPTQP